MAQQGKDLNIAYRTNDTTWNYFGKAKKASLDQSREMLKVSSPDTGNDECFIPGKKGWKMSCGCLLTKDVNTLQGYFSNGTLLHFALRDTTGTNAKQWKGQGYIKSLKVVANIQEIAQLTIEIQGTGALTYVAV